MHEYVEPERQVTWPPALAVLGIGPADTVVEDRSLPCRGRQRVDGVVHVGSEIARMVCRARGGAQ